MTIALIYWALLIFAATFVQFRQIKAAFRFLKLTKNGVYVYQVYERKYLWAEEPKDYKGIIDPDIIVVEDGSMLFFDRRWLHKSLLLTFLPIIPGIVFILIKLRIKQSQKLNKYLLKDSQVHELKQSSTDPEPSSGS